MSYFDCTEADANLFYGRTALTDELLEKVRSGNFLAVLGASGSGKSSVVRAGLLYQLKLGRRLSGSDTWQLKIFRPGINPLQNLALAFVESDLSDIERASQLAQAEELIAKGAVGLGQLITASQTQHMVLVVDQFEEAFTQCQDITKRQHFFECLLGALQRNDSKIFLVIIMRADFFSKCLEQEYGGLAKKIQEYLVTVTPMNREELKTAIIKPAELANLEVGSELVSQMIADVEGSPGSLPLLQYTLTELWKQKTEERLTLTTYTKLGGVRGTLQTHATQVYESLSPEEQQTTKRIFLELTQLGEGTEDTRRQVFQRDLVSSQHPKNLINNVIQRLADENLVVTGTLIEKGSVSGQVPVVDVAHEALIRHWLLLRKWIEESRDILRQKRKIEAAAVEWRDRGKVKDYLFQGKRLTDAKFFQKAQADNLRLSNLAIELIQTSIRYRQTNRFKSIVLFFMALVLSVYLSFAVEKQLRIINLWRTVDDAKGKKYVRAKIKALEKLVEAGESLANKDFSSTELNGVDLSNGNLSGAYLSNTYLSGAFLNSANLTRANLNSAYLSHADLSNANLSNAYLNSAYLRGANLRSIKISNAYLIGANLTDADLSSANLSRADLRSADLSGADLSDANFKSDIFGTVKNLTLEQVKSAKNWEKAKYDKDFRAKLGLPPEPAK